ncbi:MAG: hypothetical protein ACOYO9_06300 [Candidatus Nanopelagicales bacterium]
MRTSITSRRSAGRAAVHAVVPVIAMAALLTGCGPTTPEEAASTESVAQAEALRSQLLVLEASGVNVPVPAVETLTVLYGADGGIACINAESAFITGFNAGHFGSPSGRRSGVLDPAAIAYDAAVLSTYCPESLERYQAAVEGWASDRTLPGS